MHQWNTPLSCWSASHGKQWGIPANFYYVWKANRLPVVLNQAWEPTVSTCLICPTRTHVKKHSSAQEWEFLLVWLTSLLFTFFYGYKFFKILCFFLCCITELRVLFGHKNSSGKSPNGNLGKYRLENPFSCLSSKGGSMGEIGATDGVCCVEGTSQKAASLLQQLFCKNLRGCPTLPKKWGVPAASLFNIRAQRDFTA